MVIHVADNHSEKVRSYNMSRIRSEGNRPEETVRKYLFSRKLRYRKNDRRYPGCPDIILPKYKTAIFVNGCFWHMHEGCSRAVLPKTNTEYWIPKLMGNRDRDKLYLSQLEKTGWKVIIVWECELKKDRVKDRLNRLYEEITQSSGDNS
jgi:DNA mismatch endonuclease, patch repair protein